MSDERSGTPELISEGRMWEVGDPPTSRVSKLCRYPERWSSFGPQLTTVQEVQGLMGLIAMLQPDNVLELGTHAGYTAMNLATALNRNGQGHLWTVEKDELAVSDAKENLDRFDNVTLIHADAFEWTPPPRVRFQFAFLDVTQKGRYDELYTRYHHYFDVGAWVAFHDTGSFWGSRLSLKALEQAGMIRCIHGNTPRGISIAEVLN